MSKVIGKIVDASGTGLNNINIIAEISGNSSEYIYSGNIVIPSYASTMTNSNGNFNLSLYPNEFLAPPNSTYNIYIKSDYNPYETFTSRRHINIKYEDITIEDKEEPINISELI